MTKQPPRYRVRRLPEPTPPPDPRQAELLRLLLSWIDEALGTTGAEATELLRQQARSAGQLSPAVRWLGTDHPLLPVFALPPDEAVRKIIGYVDHTGSFQVGLAMLTEREAEAMELRLAGLEVWEIRDVMDHGKRRRRGMPMALKTVDEHLRAATMKLRALLVEVA